MFRRLEVNLHVTRVANDPDHPGRPIIGFVGEMRAPSTSTMYGCVQLTDDKHIKWQFVSIVSNSSILNPDLFSVLWRNGGECDLEVRHQRRNRGYLVTPGCSSVGVQVGGVGSSFGVLGAWTTVFHDHEDPVGKGASTIPVT